MAQKQSECLPLPKAARASEEIWVSIGQMSGIEMSTMGRWDSDETVEVQRRQGDQRPGGGDDDEGRISLNLIWISRYERGEEEAMDSEVRIPKTRIPPPRRRLGRLFWSQDSRAETSRGRGSGISDDLLGGGRWERRGGAMPLGCIF